jgi:hypothetical protein
MDMDRSRPTSHVASALIVAGILSVIIGIYVFGYFRFSYQRPQVGYGHRAFDRKFLAVLYTPAVWIESRVVGFSVHAEVADRNTPRIRPKVAGKSAQNYALSATP